MTLTQQRSRRSVLVATSAGLAALAGCTAPDDEGTDAEEVEDEDRAPEGDDEVEADPPDDEEDEDED